jgi:hypothetical protein
MLLSRQLTPQNIELRANTDMLSDLVDISNGVIINDNLGSLSLVWSYYAS